MSAQKTLTDKQISDFNEGLALFCPDGSGTILTENLGTVMRDLGMNATDEEIETMIGDNPNKTIDFPEFLSMIALRMRNSEGIKVLKATFDVFDKDGDGFMTLDELRHVMKNLMDKLSKDEINRIIVDTDTDGDGKINYEEFLNIMLCY